MNRENFLARKRVSGKRIIPTISAITIRIMRSEREKFGRNFPTKTATPDLGLLMEYSATKLKRTVIELTAPSKIKKDFS